MTNSRAVFVGYRAPARPSRWEIFALLDADGFRDQFITARRGLCTKPPGGACDVPARRAMPATGRRMAPLKAAQREAETPLRRLLFNARRAVSAPICRLAWGRISEGFPLYSHVWRYLGSGHTMTARPRFSAVACIPPLMEMLLVEALIWGWRRRAGRDTSRPPAQAGCDQGDDPRRAGFADAPGVSGRSCACEASAHSMSWPVRSTASGA